MAMTKRESQTLDSALRELQMTRIVQMREIPRPDQPAPVGNKTVRGYKVNQYTGEIEYVQVSSAGYRAVATPANKFPTGIAGTPETYSDLEVAIIASQQHQLRRAALEIVSRTDRIRKEFA